MDFVRGVYYSEEVPLLAMVARFVEFGQSVVTHNSDRNLKNIMNMVVVKKKKNT